MKIKFHFTASYYFFCVILSYQQGGCFDTMSPPSVEENSRSGEFVCSVLAVDPDESSITYSLQGLDSGERKMNCNIIIFIKFGGKSG